MMTVDQEEDLEAMNAEVNAIPYSALPKLGEGYDKWKDEPDDGTFECKDYTLVKAERAQALGWPQSSLYAVLCNTEPVDGQRQYHCVQAIDDGEPQPLILDSRFPQVYRMKSGPADYEWLDQQVPLTWPIQWVPIV